MKPSPAVLPVELRPPHTNLISGLPASAARPTPPVHTYRSAIQIMMLRALKLAVATHILLWSLCRGTPKGVSGERNICCVCVGCGRRGRTGVISSVCVWEGVGGRCERVGAHLVFVLSWGIRAHTFPPPRIHRPEPHPIKSLRQFHTTPSLKLLSLLPSPPIPPSSVLRPPHALAQTLTQSEFYAAS